MIEQEPRRLTCAEIVDEVCAEFAVSAAAVRGECRHLRFVIPRHVAVHIAVEQFGYSAAKAGRAIGKDHTTSGSALGSILVRMQCDEALAERVSRLKADLAIKSRMPVPLPIVFTPKRATLNELLARTADLGEVERSAKMLRGRRWSVRSIAKRLGVDARVIAHLLEVEWETAA